MEPPPVLVHLNTTKSALKLSLNHLKLEMTAAKREPTAKNAKVMGRVTQGALQGVAYLFFFLLRPGMVVHRGARALLTLSWGAKRLAKMALEARDDYELADQVFIFLTQRLQSQTSLATFYLRLGQHFKPHLRKIVESIAADVSPVDDFIQWSGCGDLMRPFAHVKLERERGGRGTDPPPAQGHPGPADFLEGPGARTVLSMTATELVADIIFIGGGVRLLDEVGLDGADEEGEPDEGRGSAADEPPAADPSGQAPLHTDPANVPVSPPPVGPQDARGIPTLTLKIPQPQNTDLPKQDRYGRGDSLFSCVKISEKKSRQVLNQIQCKPDSLLVSGPGKQNGQSSSGSERSRSGHRDERSSKDTKKSRSSKADPRRGPDSGPRR